ncbi:hypothetical protein CKO37_09190 [Rubrivivax gelatinosus]|nr:hypothetical protein [Rubrivivax gelatinosus]
MAPRLDGCAHGAGPAGRRPALMASLGRFAATRLLAGVIGLLQVLLLARWMPVAEFASYSVLMAAMAVATVVGSLGVDRVLYRQLPLAHLAGASAEVLRLGRWALAARLAVATPVAAAIVAVTGAPGGALGPLESMAFVALLTATQVQADLSSATANALLRFEAQARITTTMLAVRLLAAWAVHLGPGGLSAEAVLVISIAGNLVQTGLVRWLAVRPALAAALPAAGGPRYEAPPIRALAAASGTNYLSYLFGLPWQGPTATLIVGATAGAAETALFALLMNLMERTRQYLPLQLLQNAVEPALIRRYAVDGDHAAVARQVELLRRANFGLLALVAVLCLAFGDQAIGALTAGKYAGGGTLAALMFAALAVRGVSGGLFISANVLGEMPALTRIYGVVTLAALPLLAWAALRWGGSGVIVVSVLPSVLLWAGLRLRGWRCALGVWRVDKDLLFVLSGGLAFGAGELALRALAAPWALPCGASASTVAYVAASRLARAWRGVDLQRLREGLKGHAA